MDLREAGDELFLHYAEDEGGGGRAPGGCAASEWGAEKALLTR